MKIRDKTDLEECARKINELLIEYRCEIWLAKEDEICLLVDNDTNEFTVLPSKLDST